MQTEQESIFKAASTDALKKAASLFGIAASLYRDDREQGYFEQSLVDAEWTPEIKEQYKEELEYLQSLYDRDIQVNKLLAQWGSGRWQDVRQMRPKAFAAFMKDIKQKEEWSKTQKEKKE